LEDTITFHLIERVQFPLNGTIYKPGALKIPNSSLSFLDWTLREREKLDSLIRRFQSPDEYPFFPDALQTPILQPLHYPKILHKNDVNVNQKIKDHYIDTSSQLLVQTLVEKIGARRRRTMDQQQRRTSVLTGTLEENPLWQVCSRVKIQTEPERFTKLIQAEDREGIGAAITNEAVEKKVLERLRLKAQDIWDRP
jgi:chorismate mutase